LPRRLPVIYWGLGERLKIMRKIKADLGGRENLEKIFMAVAEGEGVKKTNRGSKIHGRGQVSLWG